MSERFPRGGALGGIDRYLRRRSTLLARAMNRLCGKRGAEYLNGRFKAAADRILAFPVALWAVPVCAALHDADKRKDTHASVFFTQERVGKGGKPVSVVKFRTLRPGSETPESFHTHAGKHHSDADPRATPLGKVLRATGLDEAPQFIQAAEGELSLVGLRCVTRHSIDRIKEKRPETFQDWYMAYIAHKPGGLFNLYSALHSGKKEGTHRYHPDIFYAKNASVGLDAYIVARMGLKFVRKVRKSLSL